MKALAFSNNDIAVFAWTYDRKLSGCLGFSVERGDIQAGTWEPLPALARFEGVDPAARLTTHDSPVQKFWWKDLGARRGGVYHYRITPMGGTPGQTLAPLAGVEPLLTNPVAITHDRGQFKAFFNRGIVASQAVVRALGTPSAARLLRHVADPADKIRLMLEGELQDALTALLDLADADHGEIRAALYELNDPLGLEVRLQAADRGDPHSRAVVLGNERVAADKKAGTDGTDDAYAENRANLKRAGVAVIDRILPAGHIPHNKFVLLKEGGQPSTVLTGSTNWTSTGLCTQTNNALLIESAAVARHYQDYWDQLERDTGQAGGAGKLQGKEFRDWTRANNAAMAEQPLLLEDGKTRVSVMFSPNTRAPLSKSSTAPGDMQHLFDLMAKAEQAILFLAFDPGNHSILDAAGAALKRNANLFVRGALTSTVRADNFSKALHRDGEGDPAAMHVAVIGEAEGAKGGTADIDYRSIPAGSVTKDDAFGAWEAELYTAGHAIIHDKIVVIDPFSDSCIVATGSHNLGWRASHNNDENFVIVHGHRPLAEAYACHVLDVYDHYAWRWWLKQKPEVFGKPLDSHDDWQDRYIQDDAVKSAEMRFWLAAVPSVVAHGQSGIPPGPAGSGASNGKPPTSSPPNRKATGTPRKKRD